MPRSRSRLVGLALALVPCLASAPAAAGFRACESGQGFALTAAWPAADATDVPLDGIVVVLGTDLDGMSQPEITVEREGAPVDGEVEHLGGGFYVWRGAPFMPNTTYELAVLGPEVDERHAFTTGTAPAPSPAAPVPVGLELVQEEIELSECVQGVGVCCVQSEVVDTERRMRATVTLPGEPAPFGAVSRAVVQLAPEPDAFGDEFTRESPWAPSVTIDFGEAGTWPGDQVCARLSVIDPLDRRADGEAVCEPIGAVNQAPGCGCAATGERGPLLLFVLVPLLRRRARGRAAP